MSGAANLAVAKALAELLRAAPEASLRRAATAVAVADACVACGRAADAYAELSELHGPTAAEVREAEIALDAAQARRRELTAAYEEATS